MATIGVDIGGTNIQAAVVDGAKTHHTTKIPTPSGSRSDLVGAVVDLVAGVTGDHGVALARVGIGAPGAVDPVHGVLGAAPNLTGDGAPVALGALVGAGLAAAGIGDVEVRLDNDVSVAARGEWTHGAGAGHDDLLALWWGTGIGGGLVLDGQVRSGPSGTCGEIGHVTYLPEGRRCGCGRTGHVEAYAGRAAMEAEARRRHDAGEHTALVELAGTERMRSKFWEQALDAGDIVAISLLDQAAEALGILVASTVTTLDVNRVILGGGLGSRLGDPWAARIERVARARAFTHPDLRVVTSALGDDAGVIGAAALFN